MILKLVKDRGHPRAFENDDDFINKVKEYIFVCENEWKQYPNIAGFCSFAGICRDTFYQQKEYYPDTYKKVQDILENVAINSRNASDTMKIFYLKNKFKYRNVVDNQLEVEPSDERLDFSDITTEELRTVIEILDKAK